MNLKYFLLPGITCLLLVSCEDQFTPAQVTDKFWEAVQAGDSEKIRRLVSSESAQQQDLGLNLLTVESWSTGKIIIDGDRSEVETEISVSGNESFTATITTYLLAEKGQWKVDYPATTDQLGANSDIGLALHRLDEISSEMLEGLDQSIDKFHQAMPVIEQELSKIEEKLRDKVPEIKQKLDEFVRQLEEALKKKQPPVQDQPVEI